MHQIACSLQIRLPAGHALLVSMIAKKISVRRHTHLVVFSLRSVKQLFESSVVVVDIISRLLVSEQMRCTETKDVGQFVACQLFIHFCYHQMLEGQLHLGAL